MVGTKCNHKDEAREKCGMEEMRIMSSTQEQPIYISHYLNICYTVSHECIFLSEGKVKLKAKGSVLFLSGSQE